MFFNTFLRIKLRKFVTQIIIIFGFILERLIIRHIYGRPLDSVVATWGISMIASQSFLIIFGPSTEGIKSPFGSFQVGDYSFSEYRVLIIFISFLTSFLISIRILGVVIFIQYLISLVILFN